MQSHKGGRRVGRTEGGCHLGCQHQPQGCRLFCFCKCAAGSGVSLHPNIASSPSTWIMQGAALPLSFFLQPLTRFKRQQQRPFHLISLRKNKAGRLQEGENLVSKSPSGLSLGRSPSQSYLLYNTGKSLTIESLVQSLGNNVTIFLWQSTTNISSSSKFMEKDPRCTMGGFLFIFSFPEPK